MTRWYGLLSLLVLLVPGCGGDTPTRNNDFTPLTSIQIVAPLTSVVSNTSIQLRAIGDFSGLFTRDITNEVTWASADETVASFALRPGTVGRVQGVAAGTATLTAESAGGVTATIDLAVIGATLQSITVTPLDPTVAKGLSQAFTASGHFDDGSAAGIDQDLTFDVAWSSSDTAVATVSSAATTPGLAAALAEGTATITAAPTWSAVTGTSLLTVSAAVLKSIALTPANGALLSLSRRNFTATGTYSDGSKQPITTQVTWNSDNSAIASIDASGLASGLVTGAATIRASLDGVTGTTSLQVTGGNLTGIAVTPTNPNLVQGTSRRLIATGTFSNGTQRDITRSVTWSLVTPGVGTISNVGDDSGKLSTTAAGTSQVQAVSGTVTGVTTLTVRSASLNSLSIAPGVTQDLLVGTSRAWTVTGSFDDGSTQDLTEDVTWSSDNPTAAQFDTSGLHNGTLKGLAVGAANLTANLTTGLGTVSSASVPVNVAAGTLVGLTLSPGAPSVVAGGKAQFTVTADFGSGITRDVTRDIDLSWSVDDNEVAVLAHPDLLPGLVYGVRAGTATVTAKLGGKSATATLTVQ